MPAAFSFTLDSTVPSAFCFSESDVSSFVVKALGIECLECRGSLPWRESPDGPIWTYPNIFYFFA